MQSGHDLGASGADAQSKLGLAVTIFVVATALKLSLFPLSNADMADYIVLWVRYLDEHRLQALASSFTDYAPGYTYVLALVVPLSWLLGDIAAIKTASLIGDFCMAAAAAGLSASIARSRSGRADVGQVALIAAMLFCLPTVVVNSGAWGQSDAIWCSAVLVSVWCMLERRPSAAVLALGVALAFKPQAIFLAPVLVGFLLSGRSFAGLLRLLLLPLPYVVLALPMVAAGQPETHVFGVYFMGVVGPRAMSNAAPSLWALLPADLPLAALPLGIAAGAVVGAVITLHSALVLQRSSNAVPLLAAMSCMLMPFVLPKMHDRYFFGGEVLVFIVACTFPRLLPAVLMSQAAALLSYETFLLQLSGWRLVAGALFNLGALAILVREVSRLDVPMGLFAVLKERWPAGRSARGGA